MVNGCEKCQAHDDRTKELFAELFHPQEMTLIALLLGNSIKMRMMMKEKPIQQIGKKKMTQAQLIGYRMACQRDIDFAGCVLGKILISFKPEDLEIAKEALKKAQCPEFQIRHEKCPHQGEESAAPSS